MTTITREQAQKIIDAADEVITALAGTNDDFHPDNSTKMVQLYDDLNDRYAPPEVVRELARAMLASMDAEPVAWECGENIILFNPDTVEAYAKRAEISPKPLYATPPVQETGVYKDMLNIIGLLENNEWAEHCTNTVLGSLLESEITRLVSKEQSVPVVHQIMRELVSLLDEDQFARIENIALSAGVMPPQPAPVVPDFKKLALELVGNLVDCGGLDEGVKERYLEWAEKTCRAAMLQAGNHTEQHLEMVDHSGDANEKGKDGTFIDEGTKQAGNSPVIPDGWISCSERMPEDEQECLVQTSSGWRYVSFYDAHSRLFYDSPKGDIEYILVTHWMPMPETPKPETNNE